MFLLRQLKSPPFSLLVSSNRKLSVPTSLADLSVDNEGIALLSMQKYPVNALGVELLTNIGDALEEASKQKCKGVILTSTIPRMFSAGLDIKQLYNSDKNKLWEMTEALFRVSSQLLTGNFVTASAINGHTSAGGCIMTLLTEYRVMVEGPYTISLNDTALNVTPSLWVIEAMLYVIGKKLGERALTTSELFTAQEALKVGLVDDVATDKEEAIERCKQFVKRFERIPATARIATLRKARTSIIDSLYEDMKPHNIEKRIEYIMSSELQTSLESYMQSMKKK